MSRLPKFCQSVRSALHRRRNLPPVHPSLGLVEPLEPRQMLSAYVINSAGDDVSGIANGQLTLREALIAAETNAPFGDAAAGSANGDTVSFALGLTGQTINLVNGPFSLSDDVLIDGGLTNIAINGQNASQVFVISTSETIDLRRMRLRNGWSAATGGALAASGSGSLQLDEIFLSNSRADGVGGGGIFSSIAALHIEDSTLSSNLAQGVVGQGGGLYVASGAVTIDRTNFNSNIANASGGGIEIVDGTLDLSDSSLNGNIAGPSGSAAPGNGGGLHVSGTSGTWVNVVGGSVRNNMAASQGGGLWNQLGSTTIVRDGAVVRDNFAFGAAGSEGGGGIFNNGGTVRVIDSTVDGNSASGSAGRGGGIYSTGGILNVRGSTMQLNRADGAGGRSRSLTVTPSSTARSSEG